MEAAQIEKAFDRLSAAPELPAAILRTVLLQAMQDPPTMRALGEHDLMSHMETVWHVLYSLRDGAQRQLPVLPGDIRTFEHWVVGTPLEDAEDAFNFVRSVPEAERAELRSALALAVQSQKDRPDSLSLLALVRLLRFALKDGAFLHHLFAGGALEDFLPKTEDRQPRDDNPLHSNANTRNLQRPSKVRNRSERLPISSSNLPTLAFFVGKLIQVLVRPEPQHPMMVVEGLCTEISVNHVMVMTVDSKVPSRGRAAPNVFAFGMASVFRISVLSEAGSP